MTTDAPGRAVLATRRLFLTPMTKGDVPSFLRQWNTAEVGRYLWDGKPVAPETVETVRAASELSFAAAGYGIWSLRPREAGGTPEPLGFSGMRIPEGQTDPELLFALDLPLWSHGYATEASRAVLGWAFATLGLPRVTAGVNPANPASARVLERLGFERTGLVHTEVEDLYTHALRREAFLAAQEPAPSRMDSP